MVRTQDKKILDIDDSDEKLTYYQILGVAENASYTDIKNQFRKLAIDTHPDNRKTGDATLFALVAKAYEYLSDAEKRSEYDNMISIEKKTRKNNFINQKKAFDEFLKAQESDPTGEKKKSAESRYTLDYDKKDRKRGFDRRQYELEKANPLSNKESSRKLDDLTLARENDEIEFTQKKIFANGEFHDAKFNEIFEKTWKQKFDKQLTKHTDTPAAFNITGDVVASSFTEYDGNNVDDDLDDDENVSDTNIYSSIRLNEPEPDFQITDDDIRRLKSMKGSKDYRGHNADRSSKNCQNDYDKLLREREAEDLSYDKRQISDYDTDNKMGGYGFLHQVGLTGREIEYDDDELDEETIKKLLDYRKKKMKKH